MFYLVLLHQSVFRKRFCVSERELRSKNHHRTFICLCGTLLGLYASFIVVTALVQTQGYQRAGARVGVTCSCLAAVVHFFTLSSISWMGVEGVIIYLLFVKVFDTYVPRFMWKAASFAWGESYLLLINV